MRIDLFIRRLFLFGSLLVPAHILLGVAHADPTGSDWHILFADEFSGTSIDRVKWATQYEWGRTHNHDAYMLDENVIESGGLVSLEATREPTNGMPYSSGVLSSHNTFRMDSGYVEARIKMANNRGSWPAFWMLKQGWPPEIDITEYPLFVGETGNEGRYSVNNYWPGTGPPSDFLWVDRGIDLGAAYHNYALQWDPTGLRYFFDGQQVKFSSYKPEFTNMYLIFNYAVGGWPGAPSTAQWASGASDTVSAEWIRAWQQAPSQPIATWTYNASSAGPWTTAGNWSTAAVPNLGGQNVIFNTLAGRPTMEVQWSGSKTVGEIALAGNTAYTLGQAGGAVENLMFAGTGQLLVNAGSASHVINSRLDLWSDLAANNVSSNPVTINGDIIGQARDGVISGGAITYSGSGGFVFNGNGYYQRSTKITNGATLQLNGRLYVDGNVWPDAAVVVDNGGKLLLQGNTQSLGLLPPQAARVVLDNGTLILSNNNVFGSRGFTIGSQGGTVVVDSLNLVVMTDSVPGTTIVSSAGGNLTLAGGGAAKFAKALGGSGGLKKTGAGTWTIQSDLTYTGATQVEQGALTLVGRTGSGETMVQANGILNGTGHVRGKLTVDGAVSPGLSPGTLYVDGNYESHADSALNIELGGLVAGQFDLLEVAGSATLAGALNVSLVNGFVPTAGNLFPVLHASSLSGALALGGQDDGCSLLSTATNLWLYFGALPAGDYDRNGLVDARDYDAWRLTYGATGDGLAADGNADGTVNAADYTVWRNNLGASVFSSGAGAEDTQSVPEPETLISALVVMLTGFICRRFRRSAQMSDERFNGI